ncbi:MAG: class I SAM-dependent methyltransferase [Planctomycetes bacterium]|nr:class I SAM-dependent methyltransferase [Planctomycetota bacterium]
MPPNRDRIDVTGLGAVEETMLIPLWARAVETRRPDGIVRDPEAVRLLDAIDFDFTRFDGAWKSQVGVAVRTRYLDDAVGSFVARHPEAVVVNLGAGLDTRFDRVDNGRIDWFDVDTPRAIALRRRCLPPRDRQHALAHSATDPAWIDRVRACGRRPVLLVSEGVLMFLHRRRVTRLLADLAGAFPSGEMLMDLIGGVMVRCPWLHDTLPFTRARFAWGVRGARDLRRWSDRVELLGLRSMLDESPHRWRWMRALRYAPVMRRQFVVAHLRFSEVP